MSFSVIVLAAGQGTRMRSNRPKVLQLLAGKPLLHHVLDTCNLISPQQTLVVCGHQGELLQQSCQEFKLDWVWQKEQRGTGHAVQCAYPELASQNRVLVLYGDVPLIKPSTLQMLLYSTPTDAIGTLTAHLEDPTGLGRIVRDEHGNIVSIVEQRDATEQQRAIAEINTGIYVLPYKYLATWLTNLQSHNEQKEYYLTDIIGMAVESGVPVLSQEVTNLVEITGVNSQQQLAAVERGYQKTLANDLMSQGVKLYDPARLDIRGDVTVGADVEIDVNVILEGSVILQDGVIIGANVIIKNSIIESGAVIHANSVIEGANIGANCQVGPFARVRPGTHLHAMGKIGNFVETKNATIGEQTKINHLSYVGDAVIGKRVNIGAGVITCNYDGAHKHKTTIEDDVFIGSNCELIAPVTIGKGATLAAGTTLMKDAPAAALTLTKKIITSVIGWRRPVKHKEEV